jgi:hypothetical protein
MTLRVCIIIRLYEKSLKRRFRSHKLSAHASLPEAALALHVRAHFPDRRALVAVQLTPVEAAEMLCIALALMRSKLSSRPQCESAVPQNEAPLSLGGWAAAIQKSAKEARPS